MRNRDGWRDVGPVQSPILCLRPGVPGLRCRDDFPLSLGAGLQPDDHVHGAGGHPVHLDLAGWADLCHPQGRSGMAVGGIHAHFLD